MQSALHVRIASREQLFCGADGGGRRSSEPPKPPGQLEGAPEPWLSEVQPLGPKLGGIRVTASSRICLGIAVYPEGFTVIMVEIRLAACAGAASFTKADHSTK